VTNGKGRSLSIAVVFPDLLGTYGDGGNGLVLARRASWRGIEVVLVDAPSTRPLPEADIYCIGGGEDGPEVRAAELLRRDGAINRAVDRSAVVLGVCAGYQLLGHSFPDSLDRPHPGLGLLDITTRKGTGARAVGDVIATADSNAPRPVGADRLPALTGFENHGAVTTLGPDARPLAQVIKGVGNGGGDGSEGAWSGRVLGSYLHGPLLARNPAVADLLLTWALSTSEPAPLEPLDDTWETELRKDRLTASGPPTTGRFLRSLSRRTS
jgi:lipid II isoglutaminyl synthase (glutamine-hydrolysing)